MHDQDELRQLTDRDGIALPDALAEHAVDLDRALEARRQLETAAAYLELHIEQGPVLESLDLPLGAVLGTFGVERHRITWTGQAAHAGSTPMDKRRDALAGAAKLALDLRRIAAEPGGRARRPRGHSDGDAVRPEPARALAHEARGHEARAPRAVGAGARPSRGEGARALLLKRARLRRVPVETHRLETLDRPRDERGIAADEAERAQRERLQVGTRLRKAGRLCLGLFR